MAGPAMSVIAGGASRRSLRGSKTCHIGHSPASFAQLGSKSKHVMLREDDDVYVILKDTEYSVRETPEGVRF